MKPQDAAGGRLLVKWNANGETFAVPLLATDVEIRVSGMVARAAVRQRFRNPHADWYEGTYVFPLPENAAVDRLRMRIGDRLVEGESRERQAAKAAYERAKQSGQRATLLEQERPNIFTSSVANIGPGEEIEVELEYQQRLRYAQARYSLRFPMVVGPRSGPRRSADHAAGAPSKGRRRFEPRHAPRDPRRRRPARRGRERLPPGARARDGPLAPRGRARGRGVRHPRLRARVDGHAGPRAASGVLHGAQGRTALRAPHGDAARRRARVGETSARSDLRHRHLGLDARRVHPASEGGARARGARARAP